MTEARCSLLSAEAGEAMAGTAPLAFGWVALEQNGPWGARAFSASHLDPAVGAELERRCAAHGLRPCLIRRPGRHPDRADDTDRTVLVSHGRPGRTWLLRGTISDPADLLALDWTAIRDGDRAAVMTSLPALAPEPMSHLLVCTNGTRDACCAVEGRPVAVGARSHAPDRVWETTHTSGHRFAATAVVLPSGELHGRLSIAGALELLAAADRGETVLESRRGRSCWQAPGQVADQVVRELTGETGLDALDLESPVDLDTGHSRVVVRHRDGRGWSADVRVAPGPASRPESCGRTPVDMSEITVEVAENLPPSG